MTTKIEEIWEAERKQAEAQPIEAGSFRLTRIDDHSAQDLYAGLDDGLHPVLGLGIKQRPPAIALESGAFDYFRRQRADDSWLLVLRLRRHDLDSVFGKLCQDLADASRAVKSEQELVTLFLRRLRLWERLFLACEDALLANHQIRGLIAELLVLQHLLQSRRPSLAETVHAWVGPTGADQDFQLADIAIEVKAVGPSGRTVSISSLRQLESDSPLILAVIVLATSSANTSGAHTLNSLVAQVEGVLASNGEALAIFRERLVAAGYVDLPRYDEDWHLPVERAAYRIGQSFPRLCRQQVPAAIVSASYDLDLMALSDFREAALPQ